MQNYVQRGDTVTLIAPANLASGAPFAVGAIFAVATNAALSGAQVEGARVGAFDLPKATGQTWSVGARLYWNGAALTTVGEENLFVGAALQDASSSAAIGRVLLAGHIAPLPIEAPGG